MSGHRDVERSLTQTTETIPYPPFSAASRIAMLLLVLSASAPEDMVIDGLGARNQAFWAANCDLCSKNLTLELFLKAKAPLDL